MTQPIVKVVSSLFLIMTLLWLSISTPFVYSAQKWHSEVQKSGHACDEDNPFSNLAEEKNESGTTLSEYLHHMETAHRHFVDLGGRYKSHTIDLYRGYHPRLILPPPEL